MKTLVLLIGLFLPAVIPAHAARTVQLSSLDLSKATQGYGQPQADKSVDGHPLTLGGQVYPHGFGTHAPGTLAIDLRGTTRFTATVGVDDETDGKGSVEFEALDAAHHILWRSTILRGGQPPKTLDLDLTGQRILILQVIIGGDNYDFDHADWADAQFDVTGLDPQTVTLPETEPVISMTPAPAAPQIHPPYVFGVRTGTPLFWTPPVTGEGPLTFSASGLPPGVSLDPTRGTMTGFGVKPGDYAVRLTVHNRFGRDTRTVHLRVGATFALTPPMGWNSYDAYGDTVTEAQVLANARYIAAKMRPYGWNTIVVDYRWYDPAALANPDNGAPGEMLTMDGYGRLQPAPNRFPSAAGRQGFRKLASEIHAMGMRFGIHIMRGIPRLAVQQNLPIQGSPYTAAEAADTSGAATCVWCPDMYGVKGAAPAGQAYYDSLFRLYASWGLDFVKMDDTSAPYHTDEINAVHSAIEACGRSIVYSLSPGETPVEQGSHVASHANMWRMSDDFWDNWDSLDHAFTLGTRWQGYAAPGHWPDADMLPLGHLRLNNRPFPTDQRTLFTHSEQVTMLSLWSLLPSPLMVGGNMPDNDPWTLALLTDPEVLAVDQDALGAQGTPVSSQDGLEVWSKKLADGSLAVGLFNRGELEDTVTADWARLGLSGRYLVRDLWRRRDVGTFAGSYSASVPRHGAVLLKLTKAG